jgi:hypothetical protein
LDAGGGQGARAVLWSLRVVPCVSTPAASTRLILRRSTSPSQLFCSASAIRSCSYSSARIRPYLRPPCPSTVRAQPAFTPPFWALHRHRTAQRHRDDHHRIRAGPRRPPRSRTKAGLAAARAGA